MSNKSNINQCFVSSIFGGEYPISKFRLKAGLGCFETNVRIQLLLLLSLYWFNSTPMPRMVSDHEGYRTGDISPSWCQPNTRVHFRTTETTCTPRSWGGGRYECHFHASQNYKDPGRGPGKTTRAPPSCPAEGQLAERTTDAARQHDTGRPQGHKNCGGLNATPSEHTRWAVPSLISLEYRICNVKYRI